MNNLALELTAKCYETKNLILTLACAGLPIVVFRQAGELDICLLKCKDHLETLVLSNVWYEWDDTEKKFIEKKSNNEGHNNFFATHPPALSELHKLTSLKLSGSYHSHWGILDVSVLQA